ncbi:hypothetical protein PPERSA_09525 [Pseudocohnilembus persalinus]|uniref:Uncharacterized protein n=1 Tax=Pseudocohnilembus persalinus TaxID=266149 RepID=A0A0V0QFF7_PSEPJ|nr:hypothetical protein PPERSA_09525 [Pseudocohnilembus persalinus]|eukprot:KRX00919.1 hypothetical protein PPERSA_09525 [Pseudocohnilembus persalinus]
MNRLNESQNAQQLLGNFDFTSIDQMDPTGNEQAPDSIKIELSSDNDLFFHFTHIYMSLKSKLSLMEGRLQDVNEIIRLKNPSLLLQIQKTIPQTIKSTYKK